MDHPRHGSNEMLRPKCDFKNCGSKLKEYGAILFGPPKRGKVNKFHICRSCYKNLRKLMRG